MLTKTFLALLAIGGVHSTAIVSRDDAVVPCTPEQRLAGGEGVIYAYQQTALGASYEAFRRVPFGDDGLDGKCLITIFTGSVTDFPHNNSMVINNINVTFGVLDIIPIPVSFKANIYMAYDTECRINEIHAYARVPSEVLGVMIADPILAAIAANGEPVDS